MITSSITRITLHRGNNIIADRVRYIGKELNNIDEVNTFGVQNDSLLEYVNPHWVLSLKQDDVKNTGISERGLRNYK